VKVLFLETVEGSGTRGEVRTVANGYARNYLLPRGYAAPATSDILKRAERLAAEEEVRQRSLDEQAEQLVGKLQGHPLVFAVRVGEQGRLYGSVTNADIAEKAGEILGEELDRRRALLPEVIRQVGVYSVPLRLSRHVTGEAQVVVVDAEAPQGVDAAVQELLAPPAAAEDLASEDTSSAEQIAADASESGQIVSDEAAATDAMDDDAGEEPTAS
jgi:large subunit ribosomal protein L9